MKIKIIVATLALGLMASFIGKADADSLISGRSSGEHFYTTVVAASATISNDDIVVYGIYNSSGSGLNYSILFDTDAANGLTGPLDALNSFRASPAILFSSATLSANGVGYVTKMDYNDGIRMKRGAFLFKSAAQSGESNVTTVEWGY